MDRKQMEQRTRSFALRSIRLYQELRGSEAGRVIGRQLLRSATSVGANYRASGRARSHAEFIAKLGIVEEEADESCYWLELIIEAGLVEQKLVEPLLNEANEITAIVVTMRRTAKTKRKS
ncbi:MAG: four helix bundle protein [Planctomycetota bacterium]